MTYQELLEHNKKRTIKQLAFLTDDIDKAVKTWVDTLGIGPWTIYKFSSATMKDFTVNGKPVEEDFEFEVALCDVGDLNLEIMMPVKGPNIYDKYLAEHGPGLHHFKEYIPDENREAYIEEMKDKGIDVIQSGWCGPDFHAYMNVYPRMQMFYEIGNCPPDIDIPEEYVRYYPEKEDAE